MLIDATDRFAKRTAEWMMKDPNMKGAELVKRLSKFPDLFAIKVAQESGNIKRKS